MTSYFNNIGSSFLVNWCGHSVKMSNHVCSLLNYITNRSGVSIKNKRNKFY